MINATLSESSTNALTAPTSIDCHPAKPPHVVTLLAREIFPRNRGYSYKFITSERAQMKRVCVPVGTKLATARRQVCAQNLVTKDQRFRDGYTRDSDVLINRHLRWGLARSGTPPCLGSPILNC
jgi:hypothetical protein